MKIDDNIKHVIFDFYKTVATMDTDWNDWHPRNSLELFSRRSIVRMTCYQAKYSGELTPSAEVEMMDWFDYSKKALTSPVDHLIFDDLKDKNLID